MIISSRQNPTIKRLKELREAKGRREQGRFLLDGPREMERALEKGLAIVGVYMCKDFPTDPLLMEKIWKFKASQASGGCSFDELGKPAFEAICYRENPCGMILEAKTWPTDLSNLKLKNPSLLILAEDIEKPGNLGTLLRTADAVGAQAIIGCNEGVDIFNPNTLRASAGAAFALPYTTASRAQALAWIKANGLALIATTPSATKTLWQADLTRPLVLAIGSEAWGLSEELLAAADEKVMLPMRGLGDSLNVSVATGAVLYEILRQREKD